MLKLDNEGRSFFGIGGKAKRDADLVMTVSLEKLKDLLEAEAYSTPDFESDERDLALGRRRLGLRGGLRGHRFVGAVGLRARCAGVVKRLR